MIDFYFIFNFFFFFSNPLQFERVSTTILHESQRRWEEGLWRAQETQRTVGNRIESCLCQNGPLIEHLWCHLLFGQGRRTWNSFSFLYFIILNFQNGLPCCGCWSFPFLGKNEGQKQIGPAPSGRDQRLCPAPRRTNQRNSESMAVDDGTPLGRFTKHFHARFRRLFGSVLFSSDDWRRTNLSADCRLHRHYPQKGFVVVDFDSWNRIEFKSICLFLCCIETSQGSFWYRRRWRIQHCGGQRFPIQVKIQFWFAEWVGKNSKYFSSRLFRATIVQHTAGSGIKSGKVQTESVAKPAIVRAADGKSLLLWRSFNSYVHDPNFEWF